MQGQLHLLSTDKIYIFFLHTKIDSRKGIKIKTINLLI